MTIRIRFLTMALICAMSSASCASFGQPSGDSSERLRCCVARDDAQAAELGERVAERFVEGAHEGEGGRHVKLGCDRADGVGAKHADDVDELDGQLGVGLLQEDEGHRHVG